MTAIKKNISNFWAALGKHGNKLVIHSYSEESIWFFFKSPRESANYKMPKRLKGSADIHEKPLKKLLLHSNQFSFLFFFLSHMACMFNMHEVGTNFLSFFPLLASDNLGIWNTQHFFCVCSKVWQFITHLIF